MPRLLTALAAAALLLALGTGCHPSCTDVCNHNNDCNEKLGNNLENVANCASSCENSWSACTNESQILDCLDSTQCVNGLSWAGELITCTAECQKK